MSVLNCSRHSATYQFTNPNCCYDVQDELDLMITNLKTEIFEKQQNCKDYCALENKFRQLQNDIRCLSEQKILLEQELAKSGNNGNILISKNKSENENFLNELNEKNSLNKKLYGDNNNLYQCLEGTTCENKNLQQKICCQENIIDKLNQEKCDLKNTIFSLNHLLEKQNNDIQNLKNQIAFTKKESCDLDNALRNKNSQNMQVINEFKNEKNINNNLFNELKKKKLI